MALTTYTKNFKLFSDIVLKVFVNSMCLDLFFQSNFSIFLRQL